MLDQAAAYGAGRIVASDVRALVGTVERERLFALLEALAASDTAAMIEALDRLAAEAADFEMLLGEVVETLHGADGRPSGRAQRAAKTTRTPTPCGRSRPGSPRKPCSSTIRSESWAGAIFPTRLNPRAGSR